MVQPTITEEEVDALVEELADVLRRVVQSSCRDMAPLWMAGTRLVRRDLPGASPELGFEPSPRYLRLGRSGQTKYRQLACWRHAVVWRDALESVDPTFARAVDTLYFSEYPANEPPYAWTKAVGKAPGAGEFESPTTLKNLAKEGCWESVQRLRRQLQSDPWQSHVNEVRKKLLKTGCRDTLRDVLKLDDNHPNWEPM